MYVRPKRWRFSLMGFQETAERVRMESQWRDPGIVRGEHNPWINL
jgi:hypothetical protein